jgi:hypothetical protein
MREMREREVGGERERWLREMVERERQRGTGCR